MWRVVVVGGGVGGLVAATHLSRRLRGRGAEVLLVDRNPLHVWKPTMHRIAAGITRLGEGSIPFTFHARRNGFLFWPGALEGLDLPARRLHLSAHPLPDGGPPLPAREVPFDVLVLALGSEADDFGIGGVTPHCLRIDDAGAALRFSDALRSLLLRALDEGREAQVAVVGGGATGVELAAALRQHMDVLRACSVEGRHLRLAVTLLEAGDRLVPAFPDGVRDPVMRTLSRLGVAVRLGAQVAQAAPGSLALKGGEHVAADLVAWTAGVRGPGILRRLGGLELNGRGQVHVRPTLQSTTEDRVFALGDCAALPGPDGTPLPATAQVARQQGLFLACELAALVRHGRAPGAFRFRNRGGLVTLGGYGAWGTLGQYGSEGGSVFGGLAAHAAHALLYRQHQIDMRGPLAGLAGWAADDLQWATRAEVRV